MADLADNDRVRDLVEPNRAVTFGEAAKRGATGRGDDHVGLDPSGRTIGERIAPVIVEDEREDLRLRRKPVRAGIDADVEQLGYRSAGIRRRGGGLTDADSGVRIGGQRPLGISGVVVRATARSRLIKRQADVAVVVAAIGRDIDIRAVVEEADVAADIDLGRACVAVRICDRVHRLDSTGSDRFLHGIRRVVRARVVAGLAVVVVFVEVAAVVMLDREILRDADLATLFDGDGESDGAIFTTNAADNQATGRLVEQNRLTFGRVEAGRRAVGHLQRQHGRGGGRIRADDRAAGRNDRRAVAGVADNRLAAQAADAVDIRIVAGLTAVFERSKQRANRRRQEG